MKRTPILRKTPMRSPQSFFDRSKAASEKERAARVVTVEFDEDGKVITVYDRKGLTVRRQPVATKAQKQRWANAKARGCVACHLNGVDHGLARASYGNDLEMHHLLSGGRRIGHDASICLCHFHHQAKRLPYPEAGYQWHAICFGPSLERESRRFHEFYGTDEQLLAYQEVMLVQLAPQFGPEASW